MTESDERAVGKFDLNANVMCPERRWKYNAIKLVPEVFGDDFHVILVCNAKRKVFNINSFNEERLLLYLCLPIKLRDWYE